MTTIRWTTASRAHIAPRTRDDLQSTRRYRHKQWSDVHRQLEWLKTATAEDPALSVVLSRVLEFRLAPTELSDDELNVLMILTSEERASEYLATIVGTERVAALLVSPTLEHERAKITRKKRLPNGAVLRVLLLSAQDAAVRARCRAAAQSVWDAGDVAAHQQLAFAFQEDEAWRAQAIAEIIDQAPDFSNEQLALARDVETMRTLVKRCKKTDAIEYPEIVASLGDEALPILFELEAMAVRPTRRVSHALAVSLFANVEAARHLAKRISHNATRGTITDYFTRHEKLARDVLPAASEGASRNAALAKELLIKVCGDRTVSASEVLVGLDDPAVPAILRDAPWRAGAAPSIPKLGLDVTTWPATLHIPEARRAALVARFEARSEGKPLMNDEELRAFKETLRPDQYIWPGAVQKAIPHETILEFFLQGRSGFDAGETLAMFGQRALAGVRFATGRLAPALEPDVRDAIDDAHVAYELAVAMMDRARVWSWFVAHPRAAAFGLLAAAHEKQKHYIAEHMLRRLAREGHRDTILSIAPPEHEPAVRAFLDRDPRLDVPHVTPLKQKLQVKRPRLRDGRALGDDVLERVFEMLAFTPIENPYLGIEDLKQACDARSLAEMAWDLATFADGARRWSQDELDWMRWSLALLADDEVIRRLTPALKHHTIVEVLEWLAIHGVRSAAMELATACDRGDAPHAIGNVARALSTSPDELAETLLPTTELADEGTTPLAYGTRTLRVGFDTTLAPILFLDDKRLAAVPRTKPDDDPVAIRLARERWDELKEDVRTIARMRSRSLQNAMRERRRIPAKHFLEAWATHPLGKHQARGMIWAVERGDAFVTFRVAEDSSLADVDDAALVLAESDFVRVPHHAELDVRLLDAWTRTFTDYQLIQPVPQLARTPLAITEREANTPELAREIAKPYPYTVFARILAEQGIPRAFEPNGFVVQFDPKTTWATNRSVCISATIQIRDADRKQVGLAALDPIARAECLYILRMLVEGA